MPSGFDYLLESIVPEHAIVFVNGIEIPTTEPKIIFHKDKIGLLSPPNQNIAFVRIFDFKVTSEEDVTDYLMREPVNCIFAVQQKRKPVPAMATVSSSSNTPSFLQISRDDKKSSALSSSSSSTSENQLHISNVIRKPAPPKEENLVTELIKSIIVVNDPTVVEERTKPLFAGWIMLVLHKDMELPVPQNRRTICGGISLNKNCKKEFSELFGIVNVPKNNCNICG